MQRVHCRQGWNPLLALTLRAASLVAWGALGSSALLAQSTGVQPASAAAAAPVEHPLKPAIRVAAACGETLRGVNDYECRFLKRERINGQVVKQTMFLRLREAPFSVYCKFAEPHAGREVLFVEGRNNGMMLAHEGTGVKAIFGTVSLALDAPEVRAENRHPISSIGLRKMIDLLVQQWEAECQYGEINVQYYPDARLGEIPCRVVESSHPQPRRQFPFHITRLYVDSQSNLPVRVENYGWPTRAGGEPVLIEEYTYFDLRTNVGFDDRHFDRSHSEYRF